MTSLTKAENSYVIRCKVQICLRSRGWLQPKSDFLTHVRMLQVASLGVLSLKHHKLHFAVVYVCSHCCLAHRAACSLHQLPTLQWCSLALCTRWWTDWWELVDINCIGNYKKEIQEINLAFFFFFPMYYFSFT